MRSEVCEICRGYKQYPSVLDYGFASTCFAIAGVGISMLWGSFLGEGFLVGGFVGAGILALQSRHACSVKKDDLKSLLKKERLETRRARRGKI